jgi:pimeloyl-ACP methyl ester carboxylesterase
MPTVIVEGRELEYVSMPAATRAQPTLVFLHEGLGSIGLWRDFPQQLAQRTGCGVAVYSRYGYGNSSVLAEPRSVDYMHDEARRALPALLQRLEISAPILVGHSDGASIALIYAGSGLPARALIVAAPHVFVEDISIEGITAAKHAFQSTDLPQRLGRYHRDAQKTFWGWNDIWLAPEFRAWNIEALLPNIACPVLAIQGEGDEYGTMAQIDNIARRVAGPCELLKLPDCGHAVHRDQPQAALAAMSAFIEQLPKLNAQPATTFDPLRR